MAGQAMTDTVESTSGIDYPNEEIIPLRFSASYASRYHHCHGSANLVEAIPGFEHPERNDDRGMKGEGTRLHDVFQQILEQCEDIVEAANVLDALADIHWRKRNPLLEDEKSYIVWWFLQHKQAPPVEWSIVSKLRWTIEAENGVVNKFSAPPRRVKFLAEALRYVFDLIDTMEGAEVITEKRMTASWLISKPGTTADVVLRDKHTLHVVDLKMGDIEVSPIENDQLLYYAKTWQAEDFDRVQLHIIQRNNLDYWEPAPGYIEDWAAGIQESERAIYAGDLTLTPGNHCTFCPANPHGRGDRGTKSCPAMVQLLYGERDLMQSDIDVLEGDEDE